MLLKEMGKGSSLPFVSRLEDPRWFLVRNVVGILGDIGDVGILPQLKKVAVHGDPRVRREVVRTLTRFGTPECEELIIAVQRLAQGRRYMSPAAAEELVHVLGNGNGADQAPHARLSDREYQVLCLLGSGKSVGQIAEELARSIKTISTYRARILVKMEMRSTAQLMHYVLQQRLAEPT